jgi:hypothetical protein
VHSGLHAGDYSGSEGVSSCLCDLLPEFDESGVKSKVPVGLSLRHLTMACASVGGRVAAHRAVFS